VLDDDELRNGLIAGFCAYVVWGLLTLYWKLLNDFEAFELVGWRIMSSACLMAVAMTATKRWTNLRVLLTDRSVLARVAVAAVCLTCNWCAYVWAVVHGNIIETALGYFMSPLGTMLVGVTIFGERISRAQRVAICFAVAAIVVLMVSYGEVPWIALILATTWSTYGGLKKRVPLTPIESMSAETFIVLVPAIVVVVALAGGSNSIPSTASAGDVVLVLLTGVATVIPLTLFAWSAQRVPLTLLGPLQYLIPTINFLLGWLVYHESLPASRVAGFALVWIGLVVMTVDTVRGRSRHGRSPEPVATV
jgi:chloramphenicol-sensitive protein RarD